MPEKNFFKKIFAILKKPWMIVLLVVVIIAGTILIFSDRKKSSFETVTVLRGNISEEVSVTGSVKPVRSVELGFEKSGRITTVRADVGNRVLAGQSIVVLDASDLIAQAAKAEADLATQRASLKKAEVDLSNDNGGILNVLADAYAKSDDAVRTKVSSLFIGSPKSGYQLTFNSCDSQATIDVIALRERSEAELAAWHADLLNLAGEPSEGITIESLRNAEIHLSIFKKFLERTNDNLTTSCVGASSAYDAARASVTTARTNINSIFTNVTNQRQTIIAQEAAVASLAAGVKSYEASVENIKAQISKMTLYAPITGVITVQNGKVGEIVSANQIVVSIISADAFQVEADIPEADVAKVKIGDMAAITLDTYGPGIIFETKTFFIDPAETIVEGVATYKTKFNFLKSDERVKSGMTANVTIFTNKRENVLVVPQRAVLNQNNETSVLVDKGSGISEKRVIETGLRGVDGNVEVASGLAEGERVITKNR